MAYKKDYIMTICLIVMMFRREFFMELKYILVEKHKDGSIEFHYDEVNENKENAIEITSYERDANIVEGFSFNECLRILNEGQDYIRFLKKSKSVKTISKGEYAEQLMEKLNFVTLFDFEDTFLETVVVTYNVYNDKRKFKMKLDKFIKSFDFDRAIKKYIGSNDDPGYIKRVNEKTYSEDFANEKEQAFEMTRSTFIRNFKYLWNEYSESWLDYDKYKPIINILKIGL